MHKNLGPSLTYVSGLLISIILAAIAGKLASSVWYWIVGPNSLPYLYIPFWIMSLPVLCECFWIGRGMVVPIGFVGVPTFLGKRIDKMFGFRHIYIPLLGTYSLILSEGTHWQFPDLMNFIPVDHRIQSSKPIVVSGLSSDGVRMYAVMIYQYSVTRPFVYLDAASEISSLEKIGASAFRDVIAGKTSVILRGSGLESRIAQNIEHEMQSIAENKYGIGVLNVFVDEIKLPDDLEAAFAQVLVEETVNKAEKIRTQSFLERLDDYIARGIDPQRAASIIQNERKTLVSTEHTTRIEDVSGIAKAVLEVAEKLIERIVK